MEGLHLAGQFAGYLSSGLIPGSLLIFNTEGGCFAVGSGVKMRLGI